MTDPEQRGVRGDEESTGRQRLMAVAKLARELLPGDSRFGDRLSTSGSQPRHLVARQLAELVRDRPGLLREAGLSALQVWEAVAAGDAGEQGDRELAIAFTDLVGFSSWALRAGDNAAVALLRDVGEAIESPVAAHGGEVVKRLGDGMMAAFPDTQRAVEAIFEARQRLARVQADAYRPRIRAGVHVGRPRRLGDDYLGVDVNVAARVAEGASGDELLVSGEALEGLDREKVKVRRKLFFRAKGVPREIAVYSVRPR